MSGDTSNAGSGLKVLRRSRSISESDLLKACVQDCEVSLGLRKIFGPQVSFFNLLVPFSTDFGPCVTVMCLRLFSSTFVYFFFPLSYLSLQPILVTVGIIIRNWVYLLQWFTSTDPSGKIYFYEENSSKSSWFLPEDVPEKLSASTSGAAAHSEQTENVSEKLLCNTFFTVEDKISCKSWQQWVVARMVYYLLIVLLSLHWISKRVDTTTARRFIFFNEGSNRNSNVYFVWVFLQACSSCDSSEVEDSSKLRAKRHSTGERELVPERVNKTISLFIPETRCVKDETLALCQCL